LLEEEMKNLIARFVRDEEGQDLIEYSLLAALISVVCIEILRQIGTDVNGLFTTISGAIQGANPGV
jgi:pilus assembly protein Flp/PilA